MAARQIVGVVLIAIGIAALVSGGFFWTRNKTVLDAGPLEVKTRQHEGLVVPPVIGIGSLLAGFALLVVPGRKSV